MRPHSATTAFIRAALFDATHLVCQGLLCDAVLQVGSHALMPRRAEPLAFE